MNCKVVQRRLMSMEDPARAPADLHAHLAGCDGCRDWHSRLILVEMAIPLVPVPRSRAKNDLLRRLMPERRSARIQEPIFSPDPADASLLPFPLPAPASPPLTWSRAKRLIAGVAALVLLLACGAWVVYQWSNTPDVSLADPKPSRDILLASLVNCDVRLATATTPKERVEILADISQFLCDQSRAMALESSPEELHTLAKLYDKVIRDGVLKQAKGIPANQRRGIILPIADRLSQTARVLDRLIQKVDEDSCKKPLQEIANSAREGNRGLYSLIVEERT